jgi:hypothetical protein
MTRGQSFEISIEGVDEPVIGTLTDFYPELSALPAPTRYFWQREMWMHTSCGRLCQSERYATEQGLCLGTTFSIALGSGARRDARTAASKDRSGFSSNPSSAWQVATARNP